MEIEFDPAKDEANRQKHGVGLSLALVVLSNLVGEIPDERHDYGEARINGFGLVVGRLYVCTYTLRGEVFRVISVRKANKREQSKWLSA
ncbi:hypothetical protein HMPREF9946_00081 [Acetobacteraceae bacterium AT-5844]|nr:hypothetical protein HMPREF9946_00081 [Acetobacteraceae bacterium AT-5844]